MDLHARAVELKFQRGLAEIAERAFHVAGRLREHGLHRTEKLNGIGRESRGTLLEDGASHAGDVAGHHHGAAHVVGGGTGSTGQRVHHYALESALPNLAEQQGAEEFLLRRGGAREQPAEEFAPLAVGAAALNRSQRSEGSIDIGDIEGGAFGGGGGGIADGRATYTEAALTRVPTEERDGDFALFAIQLLRQRGQQVDLGEPARSLRDTLGSLHYAGQQHNYGRCSMTGDTFMPAVRAVSDGMATVSLSANPSVTEMRVTLEFPVLTRRCRMTSPSSTKT